MGAVTPTVVEKRDLGWDACTGTARKLINIFIEASADTAETLDVSTYVSGLASVAAITGTNLAFASAPTFSGSTLTFKAHGQSGAFTQRVSILGYY